MIEHVPTLVATVRDLQATTVIELGVRWGVSTVAWLYALEGVGHLWSVDGAAPCPAPDGTQLIPVPGVEHWTFIEGWDTDPAVLAQLPAQADVVMLDTNHIYEETLVELELYVPRVRPGGRFLLHDIWLESTANAVTPQPPYPVRTAMREFCGAHRLGWIENPNCYGLGTIFC